jgi:hypothetical protein
MIELSVPLSYPCQNPLDLGIVFVKSVETLFANALACISINHYKIKGIEVLWFIQ